MKTLQEKLPGVFDLVRRKEGLHQETALSGLGSGLPLMSVVMGRSATTTVIIMNRVTPRIDAIVVPTGKFKFN